MQKYTNILKYILVALIVGSFFLWLTNSLMFADPDSFYHTKISRLVYEQKQLVYDFPYSTYTILADYYIDHHMLYHILAAPMVGWLGDFSGMRVFTVILAVLLYLVFFFILNQFKVKNAWLYLLLLTSASGFLFRISLVKAPAFSIILILLGIYFIMANKKWWLFLLSIVYVWSYGGFLLLPVVYLFYMLSFGLKYLADNFNKSFDSVIIYWPIIKMFWHGFWDKNRLKIFLMILAGNAIGLVINPYFPKNIYFLWVQVFKIALYNYQQYVDVGSEWYSFGLDNFVTGNILLLCCLVIALVLMAVNIKKVSNKSWFLLLLSFVFFLLTMKSIRNVEYFVPFSVLFIAIVLTEVLPNNAWQKFKKYLGVNKQLNILKYCFLLLLILTWPVLFGIDIYYTKAALQGDGPERFQAVSAWLRNNTQPGEIVFHTRWDVMPYLFYHNDYNNYIVGLDATFMYEYDKDLYNLWRDIAEGKVIDDLDKKIVDNFNSHVFFMRKELVDYQKVINNLNANNNMYKAYEDEQAVVYRIK